VCHVHEKCCAEKKEMKFITLPPYYAGNFTRFPSTSVRFLRDVGVSVVSKDVVVIFCIPSAVVLVVIPIVARHLRSVLEDWAFVSAMSRSWLTAVLAGVEGKIGVPVSRLFTFEAEVSTSKFGQREMSVFPFLLLGSRSGMRSGMRSRGGQGRIGSGRCSRNGTVGGRESDGLLVDAGRFLLLRDDGMSVFADGFHCLLEGSGLFDSEDINSDWIGRGATRWCSKSLSESGVLVVRQESS